MKEDFLHYIWKFKKFDLTNLETSNGEPIVIFNSGQYLQLAGPDFFNAQLSISDQKWAGNVEIHVKSSDWYLHHHEKDSAYENVILHVVWEHDVAIYRKNNTEIPVLEVKNFVAKETIAKYQSLLYPKTWVNCEKQIATVNGFLFRNWQERLFFERLERKAETINQLLTDQNQDWEAVLFCLLAKNFGLNTNGATFMKMAQFIPFSILRKESFEVENIESLFFGVIGLLEIEKEDRYFHDLKFRYFYLLQKYQLEHHITEPVQFFKHRPDNFPTVRLSQLANLYHHRQNLFSRIIRAQSTEEMYAAFSITASKYWQSHYQFDNESPKKQKALSKAFIDLIIINTIVPIRFAFAKYQGKEMDENGIAILNKIASEDNVIVKKFSDFGIFSKSAFQSQSLLQLKNEYCNKNQCLQCAVGIELLKSNTIKS